MVVPLQEEAVSGFGVDDDEVFVSRKPERFEMVQRSRATRSLAHQLSGERFGARSGPVGRTLGLGAGIDR